MNFVSYAQSFEDVMLWRALGHIQNGFYIDVGAQHPIVDSVSKAFYDHGWRGVNVEPTHQYSSLLRENRPDELVLQKAIGDKNESHQITFYEFQSIGLSTVDKDIALQHQKDGIECRITEVDVTTLDDLIQNCGHQEIHWLKIDVEGFEKNVLESWTENINLPWIVVIESTKPLTSIESFNEWEHLLLAKHYIFTYFDGLNRYYISPEHPEIIESFNMPPNFLDDLVLSESQTFYKFVNTKLVDSKNKAQKAEDKVIDAQQRPHHCENTITAIYARRSGRVTHLMRWPLNQARLLREHGLQSRGKALIFKLAKPTLIKAFNCVDSSPYLRKTILSIIHKLGIYKQLKKIYSKFQCFKPDLIFGRINTVVDSSDLTRSGQQVYDDLTKAISKQKRV